MTRSRSQLRLLLLQIRESEVVRQEELESFSRYCGLETSQIDILNVFDTPEFDICIADDYDALLVGGASDANVLKPLEYPFVPRAQQLLLHCRERRQPVFASCFGYQLAVLALGGEIVHDGENYEMGTLPIQLTEAGREDPLFRHCPSPFYAVSVHKQKAINPPPGTISLASTAMCNHAFRVSDAPFWAFQFHPEVDKRILIERLTFYKQHYTDSDGHLDRVLSAAVETPYSNALCRFFIDEVLLGDISEA